MSIHPAAGARPDVCGKELFQASPTLRRFVIQHRLHVGRLEVDGLATPEAYLPSASLGGRASRPGRRRPARRFFECGNLYLDDFFSTHYKIRLNGIPFFGSIFCPIVLSSFIFFENSVVPFISPFLTTTLLGGFRCLPPQEADFLLSNGRGAHACDRARTARGRLEGSPCLECDRRRPSAMGHERGRLRNRVDPVWPRGAPMAMPDPPTGRVTPPVGLGEIQKK